MAIQTWSIKKRRRGGAPANSALRDLTHYGVTNRTTTHCLSTSNRGGVAGSSSSLSQPNPRNRFHGSVNDVQQKNTSYSAAKLSYFYILETRSDGKLVKRGRWKYMCGVASRRAAAPFYNRTRKCLPYYCSRPGAVTGPKSDGDKKKTALKTIRQSMCSHNSC